MPLRIKCPSGHSLIVSESRAGQTFRCPKCQAEVRVPAKEVPAPPAEKPVPVNPRLAAETKKPFAPLAKDTLQAPKTAPLSVPAPSAPPKSPVPPSLPEVAAKVLPVSVPPRPVVLPVPEPEPVAPPVIVVSPPPAKSAALAQSMLVAKSISERIEAPATPPPAPLPFLPLESRLVSTSSEPPPAAIPPPAASPPPQKSIASYAPSISAAAEIPPPLVHSPQQVAVVFQLSAAMVVAALFSVFPSAWDLVVYVNGTSASPVGRWAIVLGMLGAVQVAYAIYLIQLPDWTTVWMVTLFALASAALYAMALGLTIISDEDGWLVRDALQLSGKVGGGRAALWCLCMMSVMTLLAFFAGRISVRWRQAEAVVREAV